MSATFVVPGQWRFKKKLNVRGVVVLPVGLFPYNIKIIHKVGQLGTF